MTITLVTTVVGLLVALSIASERFVEIIKGFVPWLNKENADPKQEGVRRALIQILAAASGIITTYFSLPFLKTMLPESLIQAPDLVVILALGLLASGGSGFWNAILGYVTNVKNLKQATARTEEMNAVAAEAAAVGAVKIAEATTKIVEGQANVAAP